MRKLLFVLLMFLFMIEIDAKVIIKGQSLANQLQTANTSYEIQSDIDLQGKTVKIPSGCTLIFNGGSVRNGTLDLNECRIEGIGIKCRIKNPGNYAYLLSCFLSDVKDVNLNTAVVQALMDAAVPVIIDYPQITFNKYLSVKSNVTVQSASEMKVSLIFPDSKGFVWDKKTSSAYNTFKGLKVTAKSHCFDFANGGASDRPMNVYYSTFSNLRVNSEEGDCFTAGQGNYGSSGDSCTFDNLFELIEVIASKGSGFMGIAGNTHHFTKIRCLGCGVAFFSNCSGVFDSCNGTWGTTPTFFKGTRRGKDAAGRYRCIFRNCNVESYKSVLFDCKDPLCYMDLTCENCSFYITPNEKKIIDYFPFDFVVLYSLRMHNNLVYVYNNGKYDNKHSLIRVVDLSNLSHLDLDRDMEIMDRNLKKRTLTKLSSELK